MKEPISALSLIDSIKNEMKRPVYTSIYALIMMAIFFVLASTYQSCSKKKEEISPDTDLADRVEQISDNYTEEAYFEDNDSRQEEEPEEVVRSSEEVSSPTVKKTATNTSNYSYQENTTTQPASSSLLSSGYMVIAGNYLLESNASEMVKKLQRAGYPDARKVVFDLSQYYTVVAGVYDNRSLANSISSELNAKGIDNYVIRKSN